MRYLLIFSLLLISHYSSDIYVGDIPLEQTDQP